MKIVVIADPEMLPPELSDNPDVVIIPPDSVDEACMAALDEASGGLLMAGGDGPLEDWASEEEKEPEHSGSGEDDEDEKKGGEGEDDLPEGGSGYGEGDEDEKKGGEGRGDDEDKPSGEGRGRGGNPFERDARQDSGSGRRAGRGRGDDEDADKGGSGRGRSPLSAWMTSLAGRR